MWIRPGRGKKKIHNTHQLKIGTILQKTAVSFLYKALAENGFSIISIGNYRFKSVVFLILKKNVEGIKLRNAAKENKKIVNISLVDHF